MQKKKIVTGKIKFRGSFLGYVLKFICNIPLFIITFGAWYFYWNQKYFVNNLDIVLNFEESEETK